MRNQKIIEENEEQTVRKVKISQAE